jgi:uncharacterized protein (TIGR02757 family)
MNIKNLLEKEIKNKNYYEVSEENPDPILIAGKYKDEKISLICSLFAYGKATLIVKFLKTIDFNILNEDDEEIKKYFKNYKYRFQTSQDIAQFFITLKRVDNLEELFLEGYKKDNFVIDGIDRVLEEFYKINPYKSQGYKFLIGSRYKSKTKGSSPYKRWNMFLRWMVRSDEIDLGLWKKVNKSDLIIPLDTHTFNVSRKLGLLNRKTYDLESAILLTNKLKEFDESDPVKYDFAIYRLGQNNDIVSIK